MEVPVACGRPPTALRGVPKHSAWCTAAWDGKSGLQLRRLCRWRWAWCCQFLFLPLFGLRFLAVRGRGGVQRHR